MIDPDKLLADLGAEAKRLHRLAGRPDGTTAGRSSGVYLAMSFIQRQVQEDQLRGLGA